MIGRLLRPVRAGERHLAERHPAVADTPATISVTSPSFRHGRPIPELHAGRPVGSDVAPAIRWSTVPAGCPELVLVVEDPSAPLPRPVVHAVVVGIPGDSCGLSEGAWGARPAVLGRNTMRRTAWAGPRPVPGHGTHTYAFQLFAVDRPLGLGPDTSKADVLGAIAGHAMARGRLDGTYQR